MFTMVDYVREMTVMKSFVAYRERLSIILFSFVCLFVYLFVLFLALGLIISKLTHKSM